MQTFNIKGATDQVLKEFIEEDVMICEVCGHSNVRHKKLWKDDFVSFPCNACDCADFSWPGYGRLVERKI